MTAQERWGIIQEIVAVLLAGSDELLVVFREVLQKVVARLQNIASVPSKFAHLLRGAFLREPKGELSWLYRKDAAAELAKRGMRFIMIGEYYNLIFAKPETLTSEEKKLAGEFRGARVWFDEWFVVDGDTNYITLRLESTGKAVRCRLNGLKLVVWYSFRKIHDTSPELWNATGIDFDSLPETVKDNFGMYLPSSGEWPACRDGSDINFGYVNFCNNRQSFGVPLNSERSEE